MKINRTSFKTGIATAAFFLFYLVSLWLAESYYQSTNPIDFGLDFGRPWNHWDYLAIGSLVFSVSLLIVSVMFWRKDD